jgi:hypothetical protein
MYTVVQSTTDKILADKHFSDSCTLIDSVDVELPSASTQFVEPANETSSLAFKGRKFREKEQHSTGPETKQKQI